MGVLPVVVGVEVVGFGKQGQNPVHTVSQLQLVEVLFQEHGNAQILTMGQGEYVMMAGLCVFQICAVKFMFNRRGIVSNIV